MNAIQLLTVWLVDFQILAALLLTIALVLRCCLRQPAERLVVAWGSWLGVLALAVATAMPVWPRVSLESFRGGGYERAPLEPIELSAMEPIEVAAVRADELAAAEPILASLPVAQETIAAEVNFTRPSMTTVLIGIWLAAMMLCCGWLALGFVQSRRLISLARLAPAWIQVELRRIVGSRRSLAGVLASDRVNSAVALCAVRPRIILPEGTAASEDAKLVRAALAHEWAHIRHGDLWLLALERTLMPLLALNPLYWWLRRGVRADQELLADAAAARESPVEYAEALLALARSAQPRPAVLAGLSMWEGRSGNNNQNILSGRIAMILDPKRPLASTSRRVIVALVAGVLLASVACLSLGTLRPLIAQEPAAKPVTVLVEATAAAPADGTSTQAEVTQIEMGVVVMSVDRKKLEAAEITLDAAIADVTDNASRREAALIVAELSDDQKKGLLDRLAKTQAVTTLSRPRIITLDGQEAHVQIGKKLPLLRVEETVNGKREERVELKQVGIHFLVRPIVVHEKDLLRLEIVAEQSMLFPPEISRQPVPVNGELPGLVRHKFTVQEHVTPGNSLLVAESSEREGSKREEQLLMVISPKKPVRTLVAVQPNPTAQPPQAVAEPHPQSTPAPPVSQIARPLGETASKDVQNLQAAIEALMQEREARRRETEQLKQKIDELARRLEELQGGARMPKGSRTLLHSYAVQNRKAADVAQELQEALKEKMPGLKVGVDERTNSLIVHIEERYAEELQNVLEANDKDGQNVRFRAVQSQQTLPPSSQQNFSLQPAPAPQNVPSGGRIAPPQELPSAQSFRERREVENRRAAAAARSQLRLLELDVAEAELELKKAKETMDRVEKLKASSAISENEVSVHQFEVQKAQIQLERARVRLEEAAEQQPAAQQQAKPSR